MSKDEIIEGMSKEETIDMLDEEFSPPEDDYNEQFRAHEHEPFKPPTGSQHKINISAKRFREIFGHD